MLIAVVGQTASGKSELALDLAAQKRGAIVSADAMALYRGLDIGTAKTPAGDRRGIAHYQIDELEPHQEASVAVYQQRARQDITFLQRADTQPVVVGGSALYLRALLDHLDFPGGDEAVRAKLDEEASQLGADALHRRLETLDPEAASRIHPNNVRRIVRALEVIQVTGRPFSATLPRQEYFFADTIQLAIAWPIEVLDERINRRTEAMFRAGLLEEVEELLRRPGGLGKTAQLATGYQQAIAALKGEISVSEAQEQVALATRQLARRQAKWFKRDDRIHWLDPNKPLLDQALACVDDPKSFS